MRLLSEPEPDEGVRRVGEVADPGEAVVPVLAACRVLGERGRRGGRYRPGGAEDEELQGERAALHLFRPRAVVGELL